MGKKWKYKLHDALWAYRTTYKTPIGMSLYQLVYGKHAICLWSWSLGPIWAIKKWNMDLHLAGKNRQAYHNSRIYKERTKRWHDKRIKHKEFTPGDKVLMFNSRVKLFGHGKLQKKWEGPFKVIETSSHGAVMLQDDEGNVFKVNGQRLKVFLEPQNFEEIDVI